MEYNLQGRLSKVTTTKGVTTTETDYEYNDSGIRVKQTIVVDGGDPEVTIYLVDAKNHTGYAQTLEERDAAGNVVKTFTIGLDVAAQATIAATYHLLYDAHGSTRVLMQGTTGSAVEFYAYDAYGKLLNLSGFANALQSALVSLLYSGEFRDSSTGWDFNRARWQQDGRFNRLDPFEGDFFDPQSLHKMLYAHGDPVNGIDPEGEAFLPIIAALAIGAGIGGTAGGLFGALDAWLGTPDDTDQIWAAAWNGVKWGAAVGVALSGSALIGPTAHAYVATGLSGLGVVGGFYGAYDSFKKNNIAQGFTRGALGLVSALAFRQSMISSLTGGFWQTALNQVRIKLPRTWQGSPTRKGIGMRWKDPDAPGANIVRLDKGNRANSQPIQRTHHVQINYKGRVIGRDGKPIPGRVGDFSEMAHIPLREYLNWSKWYEP